MNLDDKNKQICWLLYMAAVRPLPLNPCPGCWQMLKYRECKIKCSSRDFYRKNITPYAERGILDVAEKISAYRKNKLESEEIDKKVQQLTQKNASILHSLPQELSDALRNDTHKERFSEDEEIHKLLAGALRNPVPQNPCEGCPFLFSMECNDCKREKQYENTIRPYKRAGIFDMVQQISEYAVNADEASKMYKRKEYLEKENNLILAQMPCDLKDNLNRGKQLEAERIAGKSANNRKGCL